MARHLSLLCFFHGQNKEVRVHVGVCTSLFLFIVKLSIAWFCWTRLGLSSWKCTGGTTWCFGRRIDNVNNTKLVKTLQSIWVCFPRNVVVFSLEPNVQWSHLFQNRLHTDWNLFKHILIWMFTVKVPVKASYFVFTSLSEIFTAGLCSEFNNKTTFFFNHFVMSWKKCSELKLLCGQICLLC